MVFWFSSQKATLINSAKASAKKPTAIFFWAINMKSDTLSFAGCKMPITMLPGRRGRIHNRNPLSAPFLTLPRRRRHLLLLLQWHQLKGLVTIVTQVSQPSTFGTRAWVARSKSWKKCLTTTQRFCTSWKEISGRLAQTHSWNTRIKWSAVTVWNCRCVLHSNRVTR